MIAALTYTFGDSSLASERLRWLAVAYEPAMRELIGRFSPESPAHVVDLGSGPGHTTSFLHRMLAPERTTGIDSSSRFVAEALRSALPGVTFVEHDVLRPPFPVAAADLVYCRHLLAHLAEPRVAFSAWVELARPGTRLVVQETETIESDDPTLARYYECSRLLQVRHGLDIHVGGSLEAAVAGTPWMVEHSAVRALTLDPRLMAKIHLMNLRTWRNDAAAKTSFERTELDDLDRRLSSIETGKISAAVVRNGLRELVLRL